MSSTQAPYELIYWPGLPGRGEFIRLMFEEAGVPYVDTATQGADAVFAIMNGENTGDAHNPPPFAPPYLRHGDLLLNQTANILLYLAPRLGLVPDADKKSNSSPTMCRLNQLAMTALDGLCAETHDTHHPISVEQYYEDQKEVASLRATNYRTTRLPKFLGYFERVLQDLVLYQGLDGVKFAFPKAMAKLEASGQYSKVFTLYEAVKSRPKIKAYLASSRRQKYEMGIYRHYEELDDAE